MDNKLKIGFIGLGVMGSVVAKHLLAASFFVTVTTRQFNPNAPKKNTTASFLKNLRQHFLFSHESAETAHGFF